MFGLLQHHKDFADLQGDLKMAVLIQIWSGPLCGNILEMDKNSSILQLALGHKVWVFLPGHE